MEIVLGPTMGIVLSHGRHKQQQQEEDEHTGGSPILNSVELEIQTRCNVVTEIHTSSLFLFLIHAGFDCCP